MRSGINLNVMENIFTRLMNVDNSEANDYYDEERFLVCGNCHTRKQSLKDLSCIGKGMRKVPCLCKCGIEKREEEERKEKESKRLNRIKMLKEQGISDPQYLKHHLSSDDKQNEKISGAVERYINKWEEIKEKNIGLLFYGSVGRGKTFYAGCIANSLIEQEIPVIMTNVPALITAMSKDFEKDKSVILQRISYVSLLVLDDLGVERNTAYGYEKLQEIIDTRYRSGKPLIVTTNLLPKELKEPEDSRYKRVYDRILEMCHPIHVGGESRREAKARNMREEAKNILYI